MAAQSPAHDNIDQPAATAEPLTPIKNGRSRRRTKRRQWATVSASQPAELIRRQPAQMEAALRRSGHRPTPADRGLLPAPLAWPPPPDAAKVSRLPAASAAATRLATAAAAMPPRSTISVSSPTEPASSARTNTISCAKEAGCRSRGVEFAPDSPLEGNGFELSVPRQRRDPWP